MRILLSSNQSVLRQAITRAYRKDETECVNTLLSALSLSESEQKRIQHTASELVKKVRDARKKEGGIEAFMQQYDLSSEEGIALMCLAEALLRVPDSNTVDKLLTDKVGSSDWERHLGTSESWFVNAATWSLMLTGKIYSNKEDAGKKFSKVLTNIAAKSGGELAIRKAVRQGMKLMGKQFVMGRTISEAIKRAKDAEAMGYTFSYDMLGEAAHTQQDAEKYFNAYVTALDAIGKLAQEKGLASKPGLSVKLSALHPRYQVAKRERVMNELVEKLRALVLLARKYNIGLTVDAEEADRLELSLDIFEAVYLDVALEGYHGFGFAVQAYQKRAPFVIDWLADLSKRGGRKIMVRLVKGAYWDYEIKRSQTLGLVSYPVYTRKNNTDVSYLACAKKILSLREYIYPQFATHNAHSLATILEWAGTENQNYEFQCLHGMGKPLYDQVVGEKNFNIPCRIYAPVGQHEDLLAYLVRRLLENGANTSFVNRITDEKEPIEKIVADPIKRVEGLAHKPHPHIPLPESIYGAARKNSVGIDFSDHDSLQALSKCLSDNSKTVFDVKPGIPKAMLNGEVKFDKSPSNRADEIGRALQATEQDCEQALKNAQEIFPQWDKLGVINRANLLLKLGDVLEENMQILMAIAIREAGKTIPDAEAEVREAVDFCRYYAEQAKLNLVTKTLPGPTGELNQLSLSGRGVFLCISPWNFPLAIFVGQVVAALVAGNVVLAKPAEQTSIIAAEAVKLMHQVGFPVGVIQLVPGKGSVIGNSLVANPGVKGIMFTGSTETAKVIQQALAKREGEIVPFIAETGGQNCMLVDSSALPEQVVVDVVASAFGSAGQRCSALRVLFLQEDVADKMIHMLKGAMAELTVGDPGDLSTDIGPVIDDVAKNGLQKHFERMSNEAKLIYQVPLTDACDNGSFFAPCAFELSSLSQLNREVFGPILHIIRFKSTELPKIVAEINGTGYGLTFGVHSRINHVVEALRQEVHVGNMYVNRNMVGAVVGVQPFGGEGLSGTGPKAGGPNYLPRLCAERVISINTTASGGNATLLSLSEDD